MTYYAYHSRLERCIDRRAHLLDKIIDLEPVEAKAWEAKIELDVRRSLEDLRRARLSSSNFRVSGAP